MRLIFKNGEWMHEDEATVSIYDSAINFGDAIFEMMRQFNGVTFKLDEHIDRLFNSAKYVDIEIPYSKKELIDIHESLCSKNASEGELRTLIHISRGTLPIYEEIVPRGVQVIMTAFPLKWVIKGASKYYTEGIHAIVTNQRTATNIEAKVKNRSRLHYRLAELEAKRGDKDAWAILTDDFGHIAEGSGSNIFVVKAGRVLTPPTKSCLAGISRAFIFDLCEHNNIRCEERNIDLYDLMTVDEIFFTNTPFCIVPVTKLNHKPVWNGTRGTVTSFLSAGWEDEVNFKWREQARKWDSEG